ncbi:TonB-dependent receptor domain-containing protein [Luteitalea sp.]|jgi:outer membrane receptor protein involved in Fe transport|uniref:TonB-dependent receptor n=1 Tax=Luteitalea sp. TaxID=2004800 RepID=UPI0037CA525E
MSRACLTLLLALAVVSPTAPARAQAAATAPLDGLVAGLVEDALGGALDAATVRVTCGTVVREARTDATGRFVIEGLPRTACLVQASADLFTAVTHAVDLAGRRDAQVRFVVELAGIASEVTVTPARGEQERTFDVPEPIGVVTREELESRPVQLLPQALREETGVLVQQTTTAQASVFIRGFSAQRVLYLLDGVRFNTSTYRAGATQYLGWVDPGSVQRMEVVRGPSSVQYGSDALGGAVNVISRAPQVIPVGTRGSGAVELVGATADMSGGMEAYGELRAPGLALRGGLSTRAADDLRTGGGVDSHSALTRYLGLPSTIAYDRLPSTGFRQSGWSAAVTVPLGQGSALTGLAMQQSQSSVNRHDREIGGDGLFRSVYDPQRLGFGYARYQRATALGPFAALQATVSFNQQQDDRLEQARPSTFFETETARTRVLGYAAQGTLQAWKGHSVTTGAELYDESIATTRDRWTGGAASALRPEIPDGAGYRSAAVFVQDTASLFHDRLGLRAGLRLGSYTYEAPADPGLGVSAERVRMSAATFNVGAVWSLTDAVNITGSVSRGFRAANAFDLGAIGVSGGGFEVAPTEAAALGALIGSNDGATAVGTGAPVVQLGPESLYAFDAGVKVRTRRVAGSVVAFDLELRDAIARRTAIFPTGIVGTSVAGYAIVAQDAAGRAYVAVDSRPIVTRVNVDRGRVLGIEGDVQVRVAPAWIASANVSLAQGRDGDDVYLRRMPPLMGAARVKWEPSVHPVWAEAVITAAATQDRLSPGDLADARIGGRRRRADIATFFNGTATDMGLVQAGRLVPTGESLAEVQARVLGDADVSYLYTSTPGFVVVSLRGGWRLTSHVDATVIVDNLTDRNYRWHGSGTDAPGVSLMAKLGVRF